MTHSKLPCPIYSENYFSKHCIIVKDPESDFKEKVQDLDIPCIGTVIGYTQLIKDHNTYEDKRKLCKAYDLFFCDYRIYDLLRKPLGKCFYEKKKYSLSNLDCLSRSTVSRYQPTLSLKTMPNT